MPSRAGRFPAVKNGGNMLYATKNSDGSKIAENAEIAKFKTRQEAETFLLAGVCAGEFDHASAVFGDGDFGDCWIKAHKAPKVGDSMLSPFSLTQVNVQKPGTHPGGNVFWLEPRPPVMVLLSINER